MAKKKNPSASIMLDWEETKKEKEDTSVASSQMETVKDILVGLRTELRRAQIDLLESEYFDIALRRHLLEFEDEIEDAISTVEFEEEGIED